MKVFRISRDKYAEKLTASGVPNRWNRDNQYVIYASGSRSLCTLEMVARRNSIMQGPKYKMMIIDLPDAKKFYTEITLPPLLKNMPLIKGYHITQSIGNEWYEEQKSVILKVPSAIITQEYNYVINTKHPDFIKIKLVSNENYNWDERLLPTFPQKPEKD